MQVRRGGHRRTVPAHHDRMGPRRFRGIEPAADRDGHGRRGEPCRTVRHDTRATRRSADMKKFRTAGIVFCVLCVPAVQGCLGVAATGTVASGIAAQDRRTLGNYVDDERIEFEVLAAVRGDEGVSGQVHVNVTSFNRRVLLTGEVLGDSLRDRVTETARGIPGVLAVQNEIGLMAPSTLLERARDTLVTGQGQNRTASGRRTQRSASQSGHGTKDRLPHGASDAGRSGSGHGDCEARERGPGRREGHGVHRVTGWSSMFLSAPAVLKRPRMAPGPAGAGSAASCRWLFREPSSKRCSMAPGLRPSVHFTTLRLGLFRCSRCSGSGRSRGVSGNDIPVPFSRAMIASTA